MHAGIVPIDRTDRVCLRVVILCSLLYCNAIFSTNQTKPNQSPSIPCSRTLLVGSMYGIPSHREDGFYFIPIWCVAVSMFEYSRYVQRGSSRVVVVATFPVSSLSFRFSFSCFVSFYCIVPIKHSLSVVPLIALHSTALHSTALHCTFTHQTNNTR